eukprot:CAMPEP_0119528828 /NCGR_PEP_ID=MMETSP1344-20130328/42927_1 /TAXON_ID=236787 /ORGANISM="Florenciella parvula, Strain CCMP2471" /LENGTH=155 /DNA_ID=CAMNT_0007568291 /DNA_START=1 /DNA_END=468 /DNA_ORIENTATION=-
MAASFTDLRARNNAGEEVGFDIFEGKVVLVVNVAAFVDVREVPGLIKLGRKYAASGLSLLFFPCNQFCSEEPGSAADIMDYYVNQHGLPASSLMERGDVNGPRTQPVYQFLKRGSSGDIEWNFTKFVVGRDGQVLARGGQEVKPENIEAQLPQWL